MPASATSTGKALLAELSDEQVVALYPEDALPTLTAKSVSTRGELLRHLALVRRRGYATSSEESEAGVASMAVALSGSSDSRLAFNVALPTSRRSRAGDRRMAAALVAAAREATAVLPGAPANGRS
jgi:DNA-binding IclR family transcriptional regulator